MPHRTGRASIQKGYWYRPGTRSQLEVPAGVFVALEFNVEATQRRKACNHILGRCFHRLRLKMNGVFKQGQGTHLNRLAPERRPGARARSGLRV